MDVEIRIFSLVTTKSKTFPFRLHDPNHPPNSIMSTDDTSFIELRNNPVMFNAAPTYSEIRLIGPLVAHTYAANKTYTISGKITTVIGIASNGSNHTHLFRSPTTFGTDEKVVQTGPNNDGIITFVGATSTKIAWAVLHPDR